MHLVPACSLASPVNTTDFDEDAVHIVTGAESKIDDIHACGGHFIKFLVETVGERTALLYGIREAGIVDSVNCNPLKVVGNVKECAYVVAVRMGEPPGIDLVVALCLDVTAKLGGVAVGLHAAVDQDKMTGRSLQDI